MATKYVGGTQPIVYYNLASGRSDLVFANDIWRSLVAGQTKQLTVTFLPSLKWSAGPATVVTSKKNDSLAISLGFKDGAKVLNNVASADRFNLTVDGTSLGTMDLAGSQKAVASLLDCAAKAYAMGAQGDPFANLSTKTTQMLPSTARNSHDPDRVQRWVRVGIVSGDQSEARREASRLRSRYHDIFAGLTFHLASTNNGYFVLVGPFRNIEDAEEFAADLPSVRVDAGLWLKPAQKPLIKLP
jgi:hypothetical protein